MSVHLAMYTANIVFFLLITNFTPRKLPFAFVELIVGKDAYTRPIVLLVDAGTFSAAEDFAVMFMGIQRGEVVGTPTGGSTGNGVGVTLFGDDGSFANICSKHDTALDGTEFVGYGICPTIVVGETYKSHFKDKHDAAMTKALEILTGR